MSEHIAVKDVVDFLNEQIVLISWQQTLDIAPEEKWKIQGYQEALVNVKNFVLTSATVTDNQDGKEEN